MAICCSALVSEIVLSNPYPPLFTATYVSTTGDSRGLRLLIELGVNTVLKNGFTSASRRLGRSPNVAYIRSAVPPTTLAEPHNQLFTIHDLGQQQYASIIHSSLDFTLWNSPMIDPPPPSPDLNTQILPTERSVSVPMPPPT